MLADAIGFGEGTGFTFSRYDSDGDGEVDMVLMYYAGYGEADSNDQDAIWPHEWSLGNAGTSLKLDGVKINGAGVTPDIVVEADVPESDAFADVVNDPQLKQAAETMRGILDRADTPDPDDVEGL